MFVSCHKYRRLAGLEKGLRGAVPSGAEAAAEDRTEWATIRSFRDGWYDPTFQEEKPERRRKVLSKLLKQNRQAVASLSMVITDQRHHYKYHEKDVKRDLYSQLAERREVCEAAFEGVLEANAYPFPRMGELDAEANVTVDNVREMIHKNNEQVQIKLRTALIFRLIQRMFDKRYKEDMLRLQRLFRDAALEIRDDKIDFDFNEEFIQKIIEKRANGAYGDQDELAKASYTEKLIVECHDRCWLMMQPYMQRRRGTQVTLKDIGTAIFNYAHANMARQRPYQEPYRQFGVEVNRNDDREVDERLTEFGGMLLTHLAYIVLIKGTLEKDVYRYSKDATSHTPRPYTFHSSLQIISNVERRLRPNMEFVLQLKTFYERFFLTREQEYSSEDFEQFYRVLVGNQLMIPIQMDHHEQGGYSDSIESICEDFFKDASEKTKTKRRFPPSHTPQPPRRGPKTFLPPTSPPPARYYSSMASSDDKDGDGKDPPGTPVPRKNPPPSDVEPADIYKRPDEAPKKKPPPKQESPAPKKSRPCIPVKIVPVGDPLNRKPFTW